IEFPTVLKQVSELCVTPLGNESALQIEPLKTKEDLLYALKLTNEYLSSFYNDNRIPNHGFDAITKEIKLLKIENTYLEIHSFKKITSISSTVNEIVVFITKFEDYYPTFADFTSNIEVTKAIIEKIDAMVYKFGDV